MTGGALSVGAGGDVGVPAGSDEAEEGVGDGGERWGVLVHVVAGFVGAFPFGGEGVEVGLQRGVEGGSVEVGEFDAPVGELAVADLGDGTLGLVERTGRIWSGVGPGGEGDGLAELGDGGHFGEVGVVLVGAFGGVLGDEGDLVE